MKMETSKNTFYQSFLLCQTLDWLQLHLDHCSLLWQWAKRNTWY